MFFAQSKRLKKEQESFDKLQATQLNLARCCENVVNTMRTLDSYTKDQCLSYSTDMQLIGRYMTTLSVSKYDFGDVVFKLNVPGGYVTIEGI